METTRALLALANRIDRDRAAILRAEFGPSPERVPAVLLGAAFPALTPSSEFKLQAVEQLARQGLRVERRRRDLVRDVLSAVPGDAEPEAFGRALRRFVWAERARIALRELLPLELGGASIEVTARELSVLSEAALELALREAARTMRSRYGAPIRSDGGESSLCAFGMGKLSGHELNSGSDVDLLFVYDTDDGQSALTLHEHWSRVVRRAVSTIDSLTEDGQIWRVDLRLRPEGSSGPITNSVAATERYYETWGRLWERAALLRSRPIAGNLELGALIEREIFTPFVYRHAVDPGLAGPLCAMVEQGRNELSPDPTRDLKLGPGGIREAEFFVQILQLVWGGRDPNLRVPGTLAALARLASRGLVTDRESRAISSAYVFLRLLEHRVQWASGLQTHLMPDQPADLDKLGRTLGYPDAAPMLAELSRARAAISEAFAGVLPGRVSRRQQRSPFFSLLSALNDPVRLAREAERLFGSADLGEHLAALSRRPDGLLGELTQDRAPGLAGRLLEALSTSPDPEQAARYLRSFFARLVTPMAYVTALGEDPRMLARFVTALSSSQFVGDACISRPELADIVLFGEGKVSDPKAALELELESQPIDDPEEPDEGNQAFVTALCMARRRFMVEVAVADLAGTLSARSTTRLLSDLADEVLRRAAERVLGPGAPGLAVIALGKLGGRDIGYGSDLDVLFVYDPKRQSSREEAHLFYTRAAQRILRLISEPSVAGPGYVLDTRLRPSGAHGLLVTSLPAFARYHGIELEDPEETATATSSGAAWERQALLRARAAAGDAALGERVVKIAEQAAYERGAPPVEEMHRLRQRMELELGRERAWRMDLKSGRGGLLDVEFCVQWLQMHHGEDLGVRTTDTSEALEALHLFGYLSRPHFDALRDGYSFLRRLEQRIHILSGIASEVIDLTTRGLPQLARRMGFRDGPGPSAKDQLLARYASVTQSVRAAYLEALELS